jgi:hypothetical protein
MKPAEYIFGLLIFAAIVNVLVNGRNTVPIINATAGGTNQILGTLTTVHNAYAY